MVGDKSADYTLLSLTLNGVIIRDISEGKGKFAKDYGLKMDECADSITVFYPGREPYTSYKTDIFHTTFEVIKVEKRKYWNENGCRAYRRKLVSEIRENNVL